MSITLYGMSGSGNCWKPAALLKILGIPYAWQEVSTLMGETRTPSFLAKNPNGKVPLLELSTATGMQCLAESNAMLCYLAENSPWLPADPWARAKVLEWMFFEQYSHEPFIATVRFWVAFQKKQKEMMKKKRQEEKMQNKLNKKNVQESGDNAQAPTENTPA